MGHTKGKWEIAKSGNDDFNICVRTHLDGGSICHITSWSEEYANAKLIAAAPDLLKALKEISLGNGAYDPDQLKHASNCIDNMKLLALEAIKKATS